MSSETSSQPREHAQSVYFAWIAIGAGILARFVWVIHGPRAVVTDAAAYRALAHSLARGAGYATSAGPSAFWVPGWPAWMAALSYPRASDLVIAGESAALGVVTMAMTWALARRAYGPAVARVAAAIVALWPSLVLLPGVLLSENLAAPVTAFAVLLLARASKPNASPWRWLTAGLACGLAMLVREASIALVLAGVLLAMRRRALFPVTAWAAFLVAAVFVVSPWLARNRDVMHVARLTTSAGPNLCIGFGEGATGGYRQLEGYALPDDPSSGGPEGEVARLNDGLRCAKEGIARHPLSIVTLAPGKLSRLLVWDDWIIDDFFGPSLRPSTARWSRIVCNGAYWIILALAAFGIATRKPWLHATTRASAFVLGAILFTVVMTFGTGRFHVVMQPLLAVFAARGAFALGKTSRDTVARS